MTKKKKLQEPTELYKDVIEGLKSFDVQAVGYSAQTLLAHLQSVFKKKKYLFYIVDRLTLKDFNAIKFKSTLVFCQKNRYHFVVICNEFEKELLEYEKVGTYEWKIIEVDKLTTLGKQYILAKEKERKDVE